VRHPIVKSLLKDARDDTECHPSRSDLFQRTGDEATREHWVGFIEWPTLPETMTIQFLNGSAILQDKISPESCHRPVEIPIDFSIRV
jgi:hypothetical protein